MAKAETPMSDGASVTLSTGRVVALRAPTAAELRGVKLLDLLQLDVSAHAQVVERISDLSALELYALGAADALAIMSAVVGFFAPSTADPTGSPHASRTPGP